MRLGQYVAAEGQRPWAGVVDGDEIVDLREASLLAGVDLPADLGRILREWRWREKVALAVDVARETGEARLDPAAVEPRAPITRPGKLVCVGLNYVEHADEGGTDVPDEPILFSKFPTCVVGPGQPIEWDPALTSAVDYEAELVAVIGRTAREIDADEAMAHVAGFTVGNDVSARDLQMGDDQWVRGKSLDTFAPMGPTLVTPDELGDVQALDVWTELDGERLQDSNTRHMVFGVAELVAFCSRAFTLEPGDVVFTGTPDGVGYFRDPQVLMDDGDRVTVGVEGIGELTNPCVHRT